MLPLVAGQQFAAADIPTFIFNGRNASRKRTKLRNDEIDSVCHASVSVCMKLPRSEA